MTSLTFDQAFRRTHCGHPDAASPSHKCAGTVTVGPKGTELCCPVCGDGKEPLLDLDASADRRLRELFAAGGLDYNALDDDHRRRAREELRRTQCPGCGYELPASNANYQACPRCGVFAYRGGTWDPGWFKVANP